MDQLDMKLGKFQVKVEEVLCDIGCYIIDIHQHLLY